MISLGTTSVDGYVKRVKIEVLGILECETKNIRLRAVDPLVRIKQLLFYGDVRFNIPKIRANILL